jgi:NADPH-dependent 2,4-dienoyl-CoA reductase/sulfur reductase-like enzyme
MAHYRYLIIGGGMTAAAAVNGIRQVDTESPIGMISAESHLPYNRPPLSKGLWTGKPFEKIWRKFPPENLSIHMGRKAVSLDPDARQVSDDQGETYTYEKLLIATGGSPRTLPYGDSVIQYYRTLDDYQRLRADTERGHRFVVIGGGFIGSEIAAALRMHDQQVTIVFPDQGIGGKVFPADLSQFINDYFRQKGVNVLAGEMPEDVSKRDGALSLRTKSGQEILADEVIAGIGIVANTGLAEAAGLKVDNGIVVDEYLRTSRPEIYAAGDVANFYNPSLDKRMRVEHEDNANKMGKQAGFNMASENPAPYHHLPFFYSDLFDLGYEAVGELDSRLETFVDWQEPYHKGVIYYLDKGRVRGVLLWNVWEQVEAGRRLIAEPGPFKPQDLKGRLPEN